MDTFTVLSFNMNVETSVGTGNSCEWTFMFAFAFSKCHQNPPLILVFFLLAAVGGSHMETGFWEARVTITIHMVISFPQIGVWNMEKL